MEINKCENNFQEHCSHVLYQGCSGRCNAIYIYINCKLLCQMKVLKSMKNESLPFLCFCAMRFIPVAALQA